MKHKAARNPIRAAFSFPVIPAHGAQPCFLLKNRDICIKYSTMAVGLRWNILSHALNYALAQAMLHETSYYD